MSEHTMVLAKVEQAILDIVASGASDSSETAEVIETPVVRCLAKPFALRALLETVRAADRAEKRREEPLINWNRGALCPELFLV